MIGTNEITLTLDIVKPTLTAIIGLGSAEHIWDTFFPDCGETQSFARMEFPFCCVVLILNLRVKAESFECAATFVLRTLYHRIARDIEKYYFLLSS